METGYRQRKEETKEKVERSDAGKQKEVEDTNVEGENIGPGDVEENNERSKDK